MLWTESWEFWRVATPDLETALETSPGLYWTFALECNDAALTVVREDIQEGLRRVSEVAEGGLVRQRPRTVGRPSAKSARFKRNRSSEELSLMRGVDVSR